MLTSSLSAIGSGQTPAPAAASEYCPIHLHVDALKGHDDEVALTLWSDEEAGKATGTIILYAGKSRYRIPFVDAIAADIRNSRIPPTPIVVRIGPTRVDSGFVGSLDGGDCQIKNPFVRSPLQTFVQRYGAGPLGIYPDWTKTMEDLLLRAAETPPLPTPEAESVDAPECARPYVGAYTKLAATVSSPENTFGGSVVVNVAIADDGKLLGVRIDKSSSRKAYDRAALGATARSKFAPQIYRCNPVRGNYLFIVTFRL